MSNTFVAPKAQEVTIQNDKGEVVGHIKIRPSNVLWRDAEGTQWYCLKLTGFIALAHEEGDLVDN